MIFYDVLWYVTVLSTNTVNFAEKSYMINWKNFKY